MNTRLTVVVRKDLQLPEGLLAAQVTHIAMNFIRQAVLESTRHPESTRVLDFTQEQQEWIVEPYISVLAVQCLEDLQEVIKACQANELRHYYWGDTIPSPTFEGQAIKALVGISIGPADFDKIKIVTNALKLY